MSNFITCEICEAPIEALSYQRHLTHCISNRLFHINFVIDERLEVVEPPDTEPQEGEQQDHEDAPEPYDFERQRFVELNNRVINNVGRRLVEDAFGNFFQGGTVIFVPLGENRFNVEGDYEYNLQLAERIGRVDIGIANLDEISEYVPKPFDERKDDDICPICRDNIGGEEGLARKMLCGHEFCDVCISEWLSKHKRCPICIKDLEEELQKKKTESI